MLTPEPGDTVHFKKGVSKTTAAMTFIGADPDDPRFWIVRDGHGNLDNYLGSFLAIGPRPPKPHEPPESGTIVHRTVSTNQRSAVMKFLCVDPDDPEMWIVRDGHGNLDGYLGRCLALGPRPNGDADE